MGRFLPPAVLVLMISVVQGDPTRPAPGPGWGTPVQTSGTGQQLNAATAASSTTAWAVGNMGTIQKTADGGNTAWTPQTSGVTNDLQGVSFFNHSLGWTVGSTGTILLTADGGSTWKKSVCPEIRGLGLHAATSKTWTVGNAGVVRRATGGGTWNYEALPAATDMKSVSFVSGTTGWAAGNNGEIYTCSDGGTVWTAQTSGFPGTALRGVSMTATNNGWVVGGSGLFLHYDGTNWTQQAVGATAAALNGVSAPSTAVAWACGNGAVFKTINTGTNWNTANPPAGTYNAIKALDASSAWVVAASGAVVYTTTGGAPWTTRNPTGNALNAVDFVDASNGWVVGNAGTIYVTGNGGNTWTAQTSGTTEHLYAVRFLDSMNGWAAGANGLILRTTTGGSVWFQESYSPTEDLQAVTFVSATQGWAVGTAGRILATTDGGIDWVSQNTAVGDDLHGVTFADATHGWAVGDNGRIRVTSNGGGLWTNQTSGLSAGQHLRAVSFVGTQKGWAVGDAGRIRSTVDGGGTWNPQTSGTAENLLSVGFLNARYGVAVGANGAVVFTTTGGLGSPNWNAATVTGAGGDAFRGLAMPCASTGYAVGTNGHILKAADIQATIGFPQAIGTPYDWINPIIDGYVQPESASDRRPDTGWNRAGRFTQAGGTSVPLMAFQGLRGKAPVDGSLFFSFEIRGDTTFDDNDYIVLLFRNSVPGGVRFDHDAGDRRIEIFPFATGTGVVSPAKTSDLAESYTIQENGRPRLTKYWKWDATNPNPDLQNWTQIGPDYASGDAPPTGFDLKVRSVDTGTEKVWGVEVQVPATIATSSANWIDIADSFLFAFYVVRINGTVATEFSWPRDRVLNGATSVTLQRMPACDWGVASKGIGVPTEGVGFLQPQWDAITVTNNSGTGNVISTNHPNTFTAHLLNSSPTAAGTNVTATYRIANWGVQGGDATTGAWKKIGSQSGLTVPAGSPGAADSTLVWSVPPPTTDYDPPHEHQCIMVELDSIDAINFVQRSEWMNMQMAATSLFERQAVIDARGLGAGTGPGGRQKFILVESRQRFDFDPRRLNLRNALPLPPAGELVRAAEGNPSGQGIHPFFSALEMYKRKIKQLYPQAVADDRPAGYLTWTVQGYRETDDRVNINGTLYPIVEHVGGFGYVARHGDVVRDWATELVGQGLDHSPLGKGLEIEVPLNGLTDITTRIESLESVLGGSIGASVHAGVAIPHGDAADFLDPGFCFTIDLEFPLWRFLSVEALLGAAYFQGKTGVPDVDTYSASIDLKATLPVWRDWRVTVQAGAGFYASDPGDDDWGFNVGAGVNYRLSSRLELEAGYSFHDVLHSGDDSQFSTLQAGVVFRF